MMKKMVELINKTYITIVICCMGILLTNSCQGQNTPSIKYVSYILDQKNIPTISLMHKNWPIIEDTDGCDLSQLITKNRAVYKICYDHKVDSLVLPKGCELYFCGGSISGIIFFENNHLSGKVRLHGSSLSGKVKNEVFEAGWICSGDGKKDDAYSINQILNVCNQIHFQRGTYYLKSMHKTNPNLEMGLRSTTNSHIGIFKSDVSLEGDDGTSFVTSDKNVTICVYSTPYDIKHSIKNISINGIEFRVDNKGKSFHEFAHTVKLIGVNKFELSKCKFFDFWGDAICLSHYGDYPKVGERTRNSNIYIHDNFIEGSSHNNRNAISVVNGNNVTIEKNTIEEVTKENMPGAIDVEANNSAYTINNIKILNNVISGSRGSGGAISVVCNKDDAPAHYITICGNDIRDSYVGIAVNIHNNNATNDFVITNNKVRNCKAPYWISGKGSSRKWIVKNNDFGMLSIKKYIYLKIDALTTDL